MKQFIVFFFVMSFFSCSNKTDNKDQIIVNQIDTVNIKYANGFNIQQYDDYKIVTVNNAWVGGSSYKYVLYNNQKPNLGNEIHYIKIPIHTIACMSLTHVAFLERLKLEKSIISLSGCNYVNSPTIKSMINNGEIKEIGQAPSINNELLVNQSPDIVMAYGIDESSNKFIDKLESLGQTIVLNAEYMETHPLGKAEWIKFIAAFYNKEVEAAEIFNSIEKEYLNLVRVAKKVENKPTVFTNMPWNGSWYVPGGKSFQVQLFNDAGAEYLWLDNDNQSSLIKAKEIILDEAMEADFWLNLNTYQSIDEVVSYDTKFLNFKAIKTNHLYNNDNQLNNKLGNDYWESGVINPQIILKDLIKIFHPELIEHQLYYYRKME